MELIVMVLIAAAAGYFLAGSRFSKPIDETTEKVAESTKKAASSAEGWFTKTFRQEKRPKDEVVEGEAKEAAAKIVEEAAPAAKQPSRRHVADLPEEPPVE